MDRNWTELGVAVDRLLEGLEGEKVTLSQQAPARSPQAEDNANVISLFDRRAKLRGDEGKEAASHWWSRPQKLKRGSCQRVSAANRPPLVQAPRSAAHSTKTASNQLELNGGAS